MQPEEGKIRWQTPVTTVRAARRRLLAAIAALTAVLAVVVALVTVKLASALPVRSPANHRRPPSSSGRSQPFRPPYSPE